MTSIVDTLARLVAFDMQNPPGNEAPCAAYVAMRMREAGCAVSLDELAPGRVNVLGRLENGPGPVFAFNTHGRGAGRGWLEGGPVHAARR